MLITKTFVPTFSMLISASKLTLVNVDIVGSTNWIRTKLEMTLLIF